jgi:uroporphyrinogen decarboxylase
MNSRQRFLTALSGGIPDRVPVMEHLFSLTLQKDLLGFNTELYEGAAQTQLAGKFGLDMIWAPVNGFCGVEEIPHKTGETYQDEWGVIYKKNGWPIIAQIDTPIKNREDWGKYKMPDVNAPYRTRIIRDSVRANNTGLAVVAGLLGPFTMMTWYFMDFQNFSMALFMDPDLVHEMNNCYVDWSLQVARLIIEGGGVDAFQISDDWGGTNGLLVSPEHCREFFIPAFDRMVKGLSSLGLPVIMHNDGRIWDVLDDLVDTGIKGFHPVERGAGMDLQKVKERYRGRLCPIGNVNNKTTMVNGSTEDVRKEVLECLMTGAPGGGYIIATDHSLHDDIPLENMYAFMDTVKKFGIYPLDFEK